MFTPEDRIAELAKALLCSYFVHRLVVRGGEDSYEAAEASKQMEMIEHVLHIRPQETMH